MSDPAGMVYVVKDWGKIYENSRSRGVDDLRWVAVPNKHDTLGFRTLISRPNGLALYGAWCLIIQVASKCSPRGRLVNKSGIPLTAQIISVMTGAPPQGIQECLDAVQTPEIAWLVLQPIQAGDGQLSAGYQAGETRGSRARVLSTSSTSSSLLSSFPSERGSGGEAHVEQLATQLATPDLIAETAQRMYRTHPKKKHLADIPAALRMAVNGTTDLQGALIEIETCHNAWVKTDDWKKAHGRYAPPLDTWLADQGFTAWPNAHKPEHAKDSLTEQTMNLMKNRIAKGRPPL